MRNKICNFIICCSQKCVCPIFCIIAKGIASSVTNRINSFKGLKFYKNFFLVHSVNVVNCRREHQILYTIEKGVTNGFNICYIYNLFKPLKSETTQKNSSCCKCISFRIAVFTRLGVPYRMMTYCRCTFYRYNTSYRFNVIYTGRTFVFYTEQ